MFYSPICAPDIVVVVVVVLIVVVVSKRYMAIKKNRSSDFLMKGEKCLDFV
jgi:hypothetical protein